MAILDSLCAEYGNKIIDKIKNKIKINEKIKSSDKNKVESLITKALGILQENGVYAFALYLKTKSGNKGVEEITASEILQNLCELLESDRVKLLEGDCGEFLSLIRQRLANNLDKLLLVKELLERTLVYARYHVKALEKNTSESIAEGSVG
jgi:hypothetical protein